MCVFFFTVPEEQNRIQIFNVTFFRDGIGTSCRGEETSDAVVNNHGKVCCRKRIRKWTK